MSTVKSQNPPAAAPPGPFNNVLPNGADEAGPLIDDFDAATDMPNIDDRASVLEDLPGDLFVEYREGFAIAEEKAQSDEVAFGRPRSQEVAHCHPDPGRKKFAWCIRDTRNKRGNLFVLTQGVLKQHPRLKSSCKQFVIRQYVTDEGVTGLWPAPLPGVREAASDPSHLEAQEHAITRWVRVEWTGSKFVAYLMSEADGFGEPVFPDKSFEEILKIGLQKWFVRDAEHPLVRHLLKGTPAAPQDDQAGAPL